MRLNCCPLLGSGKNWYKYRKTVELFMVDRNKGKKMIFLLPFRLLEISWTFMFNKYMERTAITVVPIDNFYSVASIRPDRTNIDIYILCLIRSIFDVVICCCCTFWTCECMEHWEWWYDRCCHRCCAVFLYWNIIFILWVTGIIVQLYYYWSFIWKTK